MRKAGKVSTIQRQGKYRARTLVSHFHVASGIIVRNQQLNVPFWVPSGQSEIISYPFSPFPVPLPRSADLLADIPHILVKWYDLFIGSTMSMKIFIGVFFGPAFFWHIWLDIISELISLRHCSFLQKLFRSLLAVDWTGWTVGTQYFAPRSEDATQLFIRIFLVGLGHSL